MAPNSDRMITIEPTRLRARARFAGHVIADTDDALVVREAGHAPVLYFPMDDVDMAYLGETDRHTRCPLKGEARYWSILMHGKIAENAAFAYDAPLDGAESLKDRIAFHADKVEVYVIEDDNDALGVGRQAEPAHPPQ